MFMYQSLVDLVNASQKFLEHGVGNPDLLYAKDHMELEEAIKNAKQVLSKHNIKFEGMNIESN